MGKYQAIYADPPWTFVTYSHKGKGRSAEAHYDCLSLTDIKTLPVGDYAAPDCVLLMWIIDSLLPQGLDVITAWGFTYKTVGFTWAKTNGNASWHFGTGYWTRSNPEMCLLATRGHPQRLARDVRQLVVAPRREHSRKPASIHGDIERLVPGPYLELFARQTVVGWDTAFSQQAKLFDGGSTKTRRWRSDMKG